MVPRSIPRRPRVTWWLGLVFAAVFAAIVTPASTADRWLASLGAGTIVPGEPAPITVRVPPLAGLATPDGRLGDGGVVIARGETATAEDARVAAAVEAALPQGALPYIALFVLACVLAAIFSHHMGRSTRGRLVRVQIVSLVSIATLAVVVKLLLLATPASVLVVPVAVLALVPTMALDRNVGIATGVLAALVVALVGPFDVSVAIILLVQAAVAGLVVPEHPRNRWRAALTAGAVTTVFTAATSLLLTYLSTSGLPVLDDPLHATWFAAALGPALATVIAVPLLPLYQLLVGEITRGRLIELEDLSHPLLRQISERSPGTWQHSLMMANMAEIAANAIGADGRMVRVGAYYHDLGKSLQPKYFIENLEPGETSPHDQLPPEVSCDAIFAHVTEGIAAARRAGLHERIIDFMHMHHGNGVLEYFWNKVCEQGNPRAMTVDQFRYPGHPPQSRETAILAIVDAVEAASRTLKKPDPAAIDSLVQRIVYGKLHLGQLDESGLSMSDLRRVVDSLRETIRAANHGRIEYPWQKAQQDASATAASADISTNPRLDSLDRSQVRRQSTVQPAPSAQTPRGSTAATDEVALAATADLRGAARTDASELAIVETAPVTPAPTKRPSGELTVPADRIAPEELDEPDPPSVERAASTDRAASDRPPLASDMIGRRRSSPPPVETSGAPVPRAPTSASPGGSASDMHTDDMHTDDVHHGALEGLASEPAASEDAPKVEVASTGADSASADAAPDDEASPAGPAPDGVITPATLDGSPRVARKRAATLPPTPIRRAPTVPPPPRRSPTLPPFPAPTSYGAPTRTGGPPLEVDLDNAVTNPPPIHRPALVIVDDEASTTHDAQTTPGSPALLPADEPDERATGKHAIAEPDDVAPAVASRDSAPAKVAATVRAASAPVVRPSTAAGSAPVVVPPRKWSADLAARVDRRLEQDEWSNETPVVAPSPAQLRSLLGHPDATRQVPQHEIEALQRRIAEEVDEGDDGEPEILSRRTPPMPTAEVDPEDIEAAIEVVPPARRSSTAIAVARPPKKPE